MHHCLEVRRHYSSPGYSKWLKRAPKPCTQFRQELPQMRERCSVDATVYMNCRSEAAAAEKNECDDGRACYFEMDE